FALMFVVRIQRSNRTGTWVGFAVTGVALVYLHYYGCFVLVVLGLDLLWWAWRERNFGAVGRLGGCAAVVALAFGPWLPTCFWQLEVLGAVRSKDTWWQQLAVLPSFALIGRTLIWKEAGKEWVAVVTMLIIATVYLPLLRVVFRSRDWPRP